MSIIAVNYVVKSVSLNDQLKINSHVQVMNRLRADPGRIGLFI